MQRRPFAPELCPPWSVLAAGFAGGAAAWVASSDAFASHVGSSPLVIHVEGIAWRIAYAVWFASTHAFAAALYRRTARSSPLVVWTFLLSSLVPGAFLTLLFLLPGRPPSERTLLEPMLFGVLPALLALPSVAAIDAARRAPVPGRALATLAGALFVPWVVGNDRVFASALVIAVLLMVIAVALGAMAAGGGSEIRVELVRTGAGAYRSAGVLRFIFMERAKTPAQRRLRAVVLAAAVLVATGASQLLVLAFR